MVIYKKVTTVNVSIVVTVTVAGVAKVMEPKPVLAVVLPEVVVSFESDSVK